MLKIFQAVLDCVVPPKYTHHETVQTQTPDVTNTERDQYGTITVQHSDAVIRELHGVLSAKCYSYMQEVKDPSLAEVEFKVHCQCGVGQLEFVIQLRDPLETVSILEKLQIDVFKFLQGKVEDKQPKVLSMADLKGQGQGVK